MRHTRDFGVWKCFKRARVRRHIRLCADKTSKGVLQSPPPPTPHAICQLTNITFDTRYLSADKRYFSGILQFQSQRVGIVPVRRCCLTRSQSQSGTTVLGWQRSTETQSARPVARPAHTNRQPRADADDTRAFFHVEPGGTCTIVCGGGCGSRGLWGGRRARSAESQIMQVDRETDTAVGNDDGTTRILRRAVLGCPLHAACPQQQAQDRTKAPRRHVPYLLLKLASADNCHAGIYRIR